MRRRIFTAARLSALALVCYAAWLPGCKTEVDPDTYVGNWRGSAGDLLFTPTKTVFVRRPGDPWAGCTGVIERWDGPSPIVVAKVPFLVSFDYTVEIDKPPYRDGDAWRLEWNGSVMTRLPDHAPFAMEFSEGFDVQPAAWGADAILAASAVPEEHRALLGQWRGLGLEIVIAQDGQVRAEIRGRFLNPSVDGIVSQWTPSGFTVRQRKGVTESFTVQRPPHQVDGRWEMTIDGVDLVKVFDGVPVGSHGNWKRPGATVYQRVLDRQCRTGYLNACAMLSRVVDRYWDEDDDPLLEGPAAIGIDVDCCEHCERTRESIRCTECTPLPTHGRCPNPMTSDGDLDCRREPGAQTVECRMRDPKIPAPG